MKSISKYHFFLFLTLGLFLVGCQKEIDVPNSDCKRVIGEWEWTYSTGGFGLEIKSPKTEGYDQSIIFDKNGNYFLSLNDNVTITNQYYFKDGLSIYATGNNFLIYFRNVKGNIKNIPHSFDFVDSKTLVLSEQCYNCYSHVYKRK